MEREELIRAIGEPMRLRILELLTRRQKILPLSSVARHTQLHQPAACAILSLFKEGVYG